MCRAPPQGKLGSQVFDKNKWDDLIKHMTGSNAVTPEEEARLKRENDLREASRALQRSWGQTEKTRAQQIAERLAERKAKKEREEEEDYERYMAEKKAGQVRAQEVAREQLRREHEGYKTMKSALLLSEV